MTAPTCRRCGAPLAPQIVSAREEIASRDETGGLRQTVLAATSACSWNCLAVLAAGLAGDTADAAVRVVAERDRQITAEGYTPETDEDLEPGLLAAAGACYALLHSDGPMGPNPYNVDDLWPFDPDHWKPKHPERDLIRAAALIAAEIDRQTRTDRRTR